MDVHPLWGGQNIWLSPADTSYVQVVGGDPDVGRMLERRYAFVAAAQDELGVLLDASRFARLKSSDRPGQPDEARPTLLAETAAGEWRLVWRWVGDRDTAFTAMYEQMLGMIATAEHGTILYEGPPTRCWTPSRFPNYDDLKDTIGDGAPRFGC